MLDVAEFISPLEHAKCQSGDIERTDCTAVKIDDEDGLALHLGFHGAMLSKVDYYHSAGDSIQLIELSDLQQTVKDCSKRNKTLIAQAKAEKGKSLSGKERRQISKAVWAVVVNEFKQKWSGSIAVIERLYRKNAVIENDPQYQLLIVIKNETDIEVMDELKQRLAGMMGEINVCNTEKVQRFLLPSS